MFQMPTTTTTYTQQFFSPYNNGNITGIGHGNHVFAEPLGNYAGDGSHKVWFPLAQ
jgi:hypothetical protein